MKLYIYVYVYGYRYRHRYRNRNRDIEMNNDIIRAALLYNTLSLTRSASFLPELALPTDIPLIKACSSCLSLRVNLITSM